MLGKFENRDKAALLIAKRWELVRAAMEVAADGERILEEYRNEIAALPIKNC